MDIYKVLHVLNVLASAHARILIYYRGFARDRMRAILHTVFCEHTQAVLGTWA